MRTRPICLADRLFVVGRQTFSTSSYELRLRFDISSDAPQQQLDELLALTERSCVIYGTLRSSPTINLRLNTAQS